MKIDPTKQVAFIWHVEDVQGNRNDLTDEQAIEVLNKVKELHCPTIFEMINDVAEEMFPQREDEENGISYDDNGGGSKMKKIEVFEYCPHCDSDSANTIIDNEEGDYSEQLTSLCSECGEEIMLCGMCNDVNACEWNPVTGCKFKR